MSKSVKAQSLDDLLLTGRQMSNACFNLSQQTGFEPKIWAQHRESLKKMYEKWDVQFHQFRNLCKVAPRKVAAK